ncbi:MAG: transcriptional regulator [Bacteroidia bacterium]|nr:transcriptional regulator [Bacteroidia bacterium]
MNVSLIKNEEEYKLVLERFDLLFDAPKGTSESDEADLLALIIEEYENKHYPVESPDPIAAIRIRMEEMNLKQVDLVDEIGGKNRVSEILNRRRKLNVDMIRKLTRRLNLSASLLIEDYQLAK